MLVKPVKYYICLAAQPKELRQACPGDVYDCSSHRTQKLHSFAFVVFLQPVFTEDNNNNNSNDLLPLGL